MLTSRIQRPATPRLSPAALDAAATAFLAEAEGKKASTIRNRSWRSVIQQGPSADALAWRIAQTEAETDTDTDDTATIISGSAFRSDSDRRRPGGPARGVDSNLWNAIAILAPRDTPDHDVLTLSARYGIGESKKIGKKLGITPRRVRQIQDRLWPWARKTFTMAEIMAHLDDPITTKAVVPRAPSRRGRKARPRFLVLAPHTPAPPHPPRPYKPRARRPRWVDPLQTDMFQEAA